MAAKYRFKKRFYALLVLVLVGIGVGIYFLVGGGREGELTTGSIRLLHETKSVIIRDETSISTERYDKATFYVTEGASVQQGDKIAQIFKWGYQDDTMQALLDVQQEILTYQLSFWEDIVNPQLDELNRQINEKQLEIRSLVSGSGTADMLELELSLKALLEERMALLRDVQVDETLSDLYQRETAQQSNLDTWKGDIYNDISDGVVSFYFDGYEQALSADKMSLLNAGLLANVLKGAGAAQAADNTNITPLYRLIDDSHYYIAFLTDKTSRLRLVENETYTVVFAGYADRPCTAIALAPIITDEKQVVNILEIRQPMEDLMGVRIVEATIMKEASGLQVPLDAIEIKDGVPGIWRVVGKESVFVEVDVLAIDQSDAIIQASQAGEALVAGLRYKKP